MAPSSTARDGSTSLTNWLNANAAFVAAICVPIAYVAQFLVGPKKQLFSGGGAAAFVSVLVAIGLVFRFPGLIKDREGPEGEASTMRVSCLAIVFSFVAIMLRTGWNTGLLPSLEQQSNWVFLVSAAIGGKALQSWIELNSNAQSSTAPGERTGKGGAASLAAAGPPPNSAATQTAGGQTAGNPAVLPQPINGLQAIDGADA